jgi:hypothetical protein
MRTSLEDAGAQVSGHFQNHNMELSCIAGN